MLQDVSHAGLFIKVSEAKGQSREGATAAYEVEIEATLPSQDLSRQAVIVREGRLYALAFVPDDPEAGAAYEELQAAYEMVMDSFSFLRQS